MVMFPDIHRAARFTSDEDSLKVIVVSLLALMTDCNVERFSSNQSRLCFSFLQNVVKVVPCMVSSKSFHLNSVGVVAGWSSRDI